jgi:hypothetical protein
MNKYVYIHYESCHSKNVLKSFIQSEIKRYRLTCSQDPDFEVAKQALRSRLMARSYPPMILDEWMNIHVDRDSLFVSRIEKQSNTANIKMQSSKQNAPLIFKVEHTKRTTDLKLNECLGLTEDAIADEAFHAIFRNRPPILCLTRPKNLADTLVRAKFSKGN